MLGMAALAELALAELPLGLGGQALAPPWRRWMAQKYPGKMLNIVPDPALVHDVVDYYDDDDTLVAILMATLH